MKATVNTPLLRVRVLPSSSATVLGYVKQDAVLEVIATSEGWASIALVAGGVPIRQIENDVSAVGYVAQEFLTFAGAPPALPQPKPEDPEPAAVTRFKLGVNVLGNTGLAEQQAQAGCKFILLMDDFAGASRIKAAHPDAVVMARRYFAGNVPGVDQALAAMDGAHDKNLVYIGLNEGDALSQNGDGLRQRAQFDLAMARRIKELSGALYAAGTFSMGEPNFVSSETCDIVREFYAPAYNSGLLALDMHLYSPTLEHIDEADGAIWYERRWEFLFAKCGFDPNVRAIYCSETGLDMNGIGFAARGATPEQMAHWCQRFIEIQQRPLVLGGKAYASPILGGAIYQLGGNGDPRWDKFELRNYLDALRPFYAPRSRNTLPVAAASKKQKPQTAKTKKRKSV